MDRLVPSVRDISNIGGALAEKLVEQRRVYLIEAVGKLVHIVHIGIIPLGSYPNLEIWLFDIRLKQD
jgi:hypothetical protein